MCAKITFFWEIEALRGVFWLAVEYRRKIGLFGSRGMWEELSGVGELAFGLHCTILFLF